MKTTTQFMMLSAALLSACANDKPDVYADGVPREIQQRYEKQLAAIGDRDIEIKRVSVATAFQPLSAITEETARSLAAIRPPSLHVNGNLSPAQIEARPAGWWPVDLAKVRAPSDTSYAVLDVETVVDGAPVRYTALAFKTAAGFRLADPVLDPDPPLTPGGTEDFTATAGGVIETIPDTDGCDNLKYRSSKEAVSRFIQDSWGLFNRSVMEWKYRFGHIVSVDCKKNAAGDKCVAVNKTVDFQQDVLNSRQCIPWFTSTTTCEGIVGWSEGNSTFSSGNSFNTYYSTMQLAGDNKFDDIYDAEGASANRTGFHFRALGQSRILTTYNFSAAPALPAWALYLVNGAAAAYYVTHLIKFAHWVIEEKKGDESPWFVGQLDGQYNSEVELACPAPNAPPAPGGGGGGGGGPMPPPPMP